MFENNGVERPIRCVITYNLNYLANLSAIVGSAVPSGILLSALAWANLRDTTMPLTGESEVEAAARLAQRKPVSVYQLAKTLHLPYETVRRQARDFQVTGLCERGPDGLLVTQAIIDSPRFQTFMRQMFITTADFLAELSGLGVELPSGRVEAHHTRQRVAHLSIGYFLEGGLLDLVHDLGWDIRKAVTFLGICDCNYAPVRANQHLARSVAFAQSMPDEFRAPVSRYRVSNRLGLPYETLRRHVCDLLAEGWCEEVDGGLIIPSRILTGPEIGGVALKAWTSTSRLLESLHRVGMPMPESSWPQLSAPSLRLPLGL